jgi:hypothetical protein
MSENDRLDREVEELEERSDKLEQQISDVREDWERKQTDPSVPGAVGTPASEDELPPPEPDETD